MINIDPSEITPKRLYLSRRQFIGSAGAVVAGALALAACKGKLPASESIAPPSIESSAGEPSSIGASTDELGDPLTSFEDITHYNNYYEFSTNKEAVAKLAKDFPTSPWSVEVSGLVNKPRKYAMESFQKYAPEERIYRLGCVEGWWMVIPWVGFPLQHSAHHPDRVRILVEKLLLDLGIQGTARILVIAVVHDRKDRALRAAYMVPFAERREDGRFLRPWSWAQQPGWCRKPVWE